jgi:leucyl-tRNA synthetase
VPIELLLEDRYLKAVIEILIMIAPAIPHFSNECWAALRNKLTTEHFDAVIKLKQSLNLLICIFYYSSQN